jgi:hypothetical protein
MQSELPKNKVPIRRRASLVAFDQTRGRKPGRGELPIADILYGGRP